jgi:hypothetical protein
MSSARQSSRSRGLSVSSLLTAAHARTMGRRTEAGRHSPSARIPVSASAHNRFAEPPHADDPKAKPLEIYRLRTIT